MLRSFTINPDILKIIIRKQATVATPNISPKGGTRPRGTQGPMGTPAPILSASTPKRRCT